MRLFILSAFLLFAVTTSIHAQQPPSFTLHNTTAKSIPLWIPSVMNPNLSPFSKSGVQLNVGQKIFFKHKTKKRLLLQVTSDLEGKTLDVARLIRKRKKELNL